MANDNDKQLIQSSTHSIKNFLAKHWVKVPIVAVSGLGAVLFYGPSKRFALEHNSFSFIFKSEHIFPWAACITNFFDHAFTGEETIKKIRKHGATFKNGFFLVVAGAAGIPVAIVEIDENSEDPSFFSYLVFSCALLCEMVENNIGMHELWNFLKNIGQGNELNLEPFIEELIDFHEYLQESSISEARKGEIRQALKAAIDPTQYQGKSEKNYMKSRLGTLVGTGGAILGVGSMLGFVMLLHTQLSDLLPISVQPGLTYVLDGVISLPFLSLVAYFDKENLQSITNVTLNLLSGRPQLAWSLARNMGNTKGLVFVPFCLLIGMSFYLGFNSHGVAALQMLDHFSSIDQTFATVMAFYFVRAGYTIFKSYSMSTILTNLYNSLAKWLGGEEQYRHIIAHHFNDIRAELVEEGILDEHAQATARYRNPVSYGSFPAAGQEEQARIPLVNFNASINQNMSAGNKSEVLYHQVGRVIDNIGNTHVPSHEIEAQCKEAFSFFSTRNHRKPNAPRESACEKVTNWMRHACSCTIQ